MSYSYNVAIILLSAPIRLIEMQHHQYNIHVHVFVKKIFAEELKMLIEV